MIGGNTTAEVQVKTTVKNSIGAGVASYKTVQTLKGWLDLSSGDSRYTNYSAKIQESTHIFICDYVELEVKAENSRLLVNGERYDITLIDDPMGMHQQLEIYLRYTGGQ